MAAQPRHKTSSVGPNVPSKSDIFATLCHLVSQIDAEDRMQEVIKKAQELKNGDLQLLIDCLSMSLDRNAAPVKCRDYVWRSLIKIASATKVLAQNHTLDTGCLVHETGSPPGTYSISGNTSLHVKTLRKIENNQAHHSEEIVSWIYIFHPNVVPVYSTFLDDGLKLSLVSPNITQGNVCDYMQKHPEVPRMALVSDITNGLSYLHDHGIIHSGLYLILSSKWPFFQIKGDCVLGTISHGSKPVQPGVDGVGGDEINDTTWQTLLMCWKLEPSEHPPCLKVYQIIVGMGIRDERPIKKPIIGSDALKSSVIDLEHAKSSLMGVLGSEAASSLRVPEHLCDSLLRLIPDTNKLELAAAVVLKLSPDETQCLADFLDLNAMPLVLSSPLITFSTPIIPKRYILNSVHYDMQKPVAEGAFGKAYEGCGLSVRVNIVSDPGFRKRRLQSLPDWSHTSHHNIIQFHGMFLDDISGGSQNLCIVTPLWRNGNLRDYAPTLPQKKRIHLLLDVAVALNHLHTELNYMFGPSILTTDRALISDQGRSVLALFGTHPDKTKAYEDDMWSFGGLCYEVLSGKPPYYQYTEVAEIESAISRGELPRRPTDTDEGMEMIDDDMWGLIEQCYSSDWQDQPMALRVVEMIASIVETENGCPPAEGSPDASILALRSRAEVNFPDIEALLGRIRIKDVVAAAVELLSNNIRTLVDFLDLTLKDYLLKSDERNRVLALLSKLTSTTRTFPQCYKVTGVKYQPVPIAEGGFGTVHRGLDLNMCVKVMSQVDTSALTEWIKELVLWSHSSHPNVLLFYRVFLKSIGQSQRICLVSPFMKNGNLHDYAPCLPQKSRLPLLLDVIKGLGYLHVYGIIHSDLKGQNVLISDEGRGLLTDFGASHIVTATAAPTTSKISKTFCFAAPELVEDRAQPSKESDVWAFGCLCYEVLSRKSLYYQYPRDFQVVAAPISQRTAKATKFHDDWDPIDDQAWNLVTKCCAPELGDRLKIPATQELIADMKVWDNQTAMKVVPGADIFKLRFKPDINLNRVGEILDQLQAQVAPPEPEEHSFIEFFNYL
ncbi:hypothetical protein NP233_g10053 [Leucocoprinus birnbaumii]|uniref:Protein kinase domain-containing protein n=1 Tax=Leucocoprinus birnbaumii TaxID=56174 RepID=A0AAD5VL11_9AGAR|nr:hypothetical protein NP233_g10053 [Leucocoprinus birnbaumii]